MIFTKQTERPASEIVPQIMEALANMKGQLAGVQEPQAGANVLLSLAASITDLENYLTQFGGNQRIIDYANAEAAKNSLYATGYNVQVDFAAVMGALAAIKTFISAINFSGAVSLNVAGQTQWALITITGLQLEIDKFNAVVG